MYKKFFGILFLCVVLLLGCLACKEDAPATTTAPSDPADTTPTGTTLDHNSGVVDMPTDFTPPADDSVLDATLGATEGTEPDVTPTQPTVTPTKPVEDPTKPVEDPTQPSVQPTLPDKPADQVTFEEFMAMDPYTQTDFIRTFAPEDFHAWFQAAIAAYQEEHPDFEYNGGAIELPQ